MATHLPGHRPHPRPPTRPQPNAWWLSAALLGLLPVAQATPTTPTAQFAPVASAAVTAQTASPAPAIDPTARGASPAEPRFDLSLNGAPAPQVFLQLGMASSWQVLAGPDVAGSITLQLRDTTVPEALEALRELYGYDFRISGRRVYVQPNTVQTRLFRVNYLPGRRQGSSDLQVSSASITAAGSGGNGANGQANANGNAYGNGNGNGGGNPGGQNGQGSGSTGRSDHSSSVRTSSDADFWRDVQASLKSLLGLADGGEGGGDPTPGPRRSLVLNPAAGLVVVRATPAELRQVEAYLQAVQVNIERQVMLEAKILEVELGNESQSGVNWSAFGRALGGAFSGGLAQPGTTLSATGALTANGSTLTAGSTLAAGASAAPFYGLAFQATHFAALLSFLETQGKVQVLSSPRIATLNNQKAVLKVGSDELYVTGVSSTTSSTGSTSTSTPSVVLQPFFSGISLDVTPQIDEHGQVMLHVHPAISTVSEKQKNINLGSLGSYQLPLASSAVNETDSIVRVRDGQIVAIGGLMSQEQREERSALPGLGEAPIIGGLFRQTRTVLRKRELVILIKPTVIAADGPWPDADPRQPASTLLPQGFPSSKADEPAPAPAASRPVLAIDGTAAPALPTAQAIGPAR